MPGNHVEQPVGGVLGMARRSAPRARMEEITEGLITPERGYEQSAVTLWRRREGVDDFEVITPAVSADYTRGRPKGQHVPIDLMRLAARLKAEAQGGGPI